MPKRLVFVPEAHSRSRRQESANAAKTFKRGNLNVKLFLEGTAKSDIERESKKVDFPVCETEAEEMIAATRLFVLYPLSWFNSFINAQKNEGDPESDQFVRDFVARYTGQPVDQDNLEFQAFMAQQNFVNDEMFHAFSVAVAGGLRLTPEEFTSIVEEITQGQFDGIAPSFKALIARTIEEMREVRLVEGVRSALDHATTSLLDKFRINLTLPQPTQVLDLSALEAGIRMDDPLVFSATIGPMFDTVSAYREIYVAHCIGGQEFEVGIVNMGENHTNSRNFRQLLSATGISSIHVLQEQR